MSRFREEMAERVVIVLGRNNLNPDDRWMEWILISNQHMESNTYIYNSLNYGILTMGYWSLPFPIKTLTLTTSNLTLHLLYHSCR